MLRTVASPTGDRINSSIGPVRTTLDGLLEEALELSIRTREYALTVVDTLSVGPVIGGNMVPSFA
jgi:hypothetical protein